MSRKAAGAREARALLDVATRESDPDRVGAELDAIADAMRTQPEVQALLLRPGLPIARRVQALQLIASSLGLTPLVSKLLTAFAELDSLRLVPDLAAAYRTRLLDRKNIVSAEITTAVPLTPETADRVGRALGQASGKQVLVSTRVDPAIIGGVVARVGSTVYDGSVTTQLARMRQKLVENV
jgi:F-type H+-transporting ATPase subunit delta